MKKIHDYLDLVLVATLVILVGIVVVSVAHPIECGTCGAHVYEYWYTPSDDGSGLIQICERCANIIDNQ